MPKKKNPKGTKRAAARARSGRASGRGPANEAVRFAVIGQGYFAQASVLPAFANAKNCRLVALFSDDETKLRVLKRRYGVEAALPYEEYDAYLRSGAVDAVYIALPNDLHCDYTVRAAAARVHVLCEKPLAVDGDEAERMITACRQAGVKLMTAYRLHFEEGSLRAGEAVAKGKLGEPRFFSSTFGMQVRKDNVRAQDVRGAGPLYDLGVYCVNAARALFRDEPTQVTAFAGKREGDDRFERIDEHVTAVLRFPQDRLAQFTCSFGAYDHSSYEVVGTKGRLVMEPGYDNVTPLVLRTEIAGRPPTRQVFKKRDQVAPELIDFARCIREDREPEPSGEEGLADLRVIEAIQESVRAGTAVSVRRVERDQRPSMRQERHAPPHGMPALVNAHPPSQG